MTEKKKSCDRFRKRGKKKEEKSAKRETDRALPRRFLRRKQETDKEAAII